jgi:glycerol uptake facilitator-like aquaporin
VTLARGFTTTFAGIDMTHVPAFIVAQLVGAAIGAVVATLIFDPATPQKPGK